MKRLFAAINIQASEAFIHLHRELRNQLKHEKIKWVSPSSIHITLKFFGETEEDRIQHINNILTEVAQRHAPFEIAVQNVGVFGSSYNPRLIWFGIEPQTAIKNLVNDVLDGVEAIGWKRDRQNFVPHLTVGRIKSLSDKQLFHSIISAKKNADIQSVGVREFHLIESKLRPQGPEYTRLNTFMFSE